MKEALGEENPLLAKSLHDHTLVRAELNILGQSEISDQRTIDTANKMFADLSAHVKEEETSLFPLLKYVHEKSLQSDAIAEEIFFVAREKLTETQLAQLGGMLMTLKTQAPLTELFMQTEV